MIYPANIHRILFWHANEIAVIECEFFRRSIGYLNASVNQATPFLLGNSLPTIQQE